MMENAAAQISVAVDERGLTRVACLVDEEVFLKVIVSRAIGLHRASKSEEKTGSFAFLRVRSTRMILFELSLRKLSYNSRRARSPLQKSTVKP